MKKVFFTALVAVFFANTNLQAQNKTFGVTAGYSSHIQRLSADEGSLSVSTEGFFIGLFKEFSISDTYSIQPELQFNSFTRGGETLNLLIVPVMFKFPLADRFNLQAGPQLDLIVSDSDGANALGYGIAFGGQFHISKRFSLVARYSFGLNNRLDDDLLSDDVKIKFNTLQAGLTYNF